MKTQHKDSLFKGIFKIAPNFIQLLEKCKGSKVTLTPDDIIPFDLSSETLLRKRLNDVSFLTKDNRLIILIEHQSTINPNMALRMFLYYSELLQLWIKLNNINLFAGRKITNLPTPEFYVAYNGTEPLKENKSIFSLEHKGTSIAVEVEVVDIHFEKLEDKQPTNALAGYAFFYKIYEEELKKGVIGQEAFNTAREECIKQGYLKGFIEKEDFIMFYKDIFDYDTQLRAEGEARGKAGVLTQMREFQERGFSAEDIIKILLNNQEEQPV